VRVPLRAEDALRTIRGIRLDGRLRREKAPVLIAGGRRIGRPLAAALGPRRQKGFSLTILLEGRLPRSAKRNRRGRRQSSGSQLRLLFCFSQTTAVSCFGISRRPAKRPGGAGAIAGLLSPRIRLMGRRRMDGGGGDWRGQIHPHLSDLRDAVPFDARFRQPLCGGASRRGDLPHGALFPQGLAAARELIGTCVCFSLSSRADGWIGEYRPGRRDNSVTAAISPKWANAVTGRAADRAWPTACGSNVPQKSRLNGARRAAARSPCTPPIARWIPTIVVECRRIYALETPGRRFWDGDENANIYSCIPLCSGLERLFNLVVPYHKRNAPGAGSRGQAGSPRTR